MSSRSAKLLRTEWLWTSLPIAIMVVLAAWSFWLVRTSEVNQPKNAAVALSAEPDMVIERFVARTYDAAGELSSWIKGAQAWHHPLDDSLVVAQADMTSFRGDEARPVTVTAQSKEMRVNGAQTVFKLIGNARVQKVVSPRGGPVSTMTFLGEELLVDEDRSVVIADQPVTLLKGNQRLEGNRMRYDEDKGVLQLDGRVRWQQAGRSAKAS